MKQESLQWYLFSKVPFLLLLFLFYLSPVFLFAQKVIASKQPDIMNWQLDATVKGVDFYHALVQCNGKRVVFLKLNNKTTGRVEVSWKETFTTQEGPQIKGYFGKKSLVLNTGETKETDCNTPSIKELVVLPGQVVPTYVADISRFDYQSIQVTELK